MVNDENEALKKNRHRLLNKFTGVFSNVADIGKLAKK
jgi:glycyl-tRNA synthetase beta subunit